MKQLYKNVNNILELKIDASFFFYSIFSYFAELFHLNLVHHPFTPRKRRAVNSHSCLFDVGAHRMYFNSLSFPSVAYNLF